MRLVPVICHYRRAPEARDELLLLLRLALDTELLFDAELLLRLALAAELLFDAELLLRLALDAELLLDSALLLRLALDAASFLLALSRRDDTTSDTTAVRLFSSESMLTLRLFSSREGTYTNPAFRSLTLFS